MPYKYGTEQINARIFCIDGSVKLDNPLMENSLAIVELIQRHSLQSILLIGGLLDLVQRWVCQSQS